MTISTGQERSGGAGILEPMTPTPTEQAAPRSRQLLGVLLATLIASIAVGGVLGGYAIGRTTRDRYVERVRTVITTENTVRSLYEALGQELDDPVTARALGRIYDTPPGNRDALYRSSGHAEWMSDVPPAYPRPECSVLGSFTLRNVEEAAFALDRAKAHLIFVLQPNIVSTAKALTEHEQRILQKQDKSYWDACYQSMRDRLGCSTCPDPLASSTARPNCSSTAITSPTGVTA